MFKTNNHSAFRFLNAVVVMILAAQLGMIGNARARFYSAESVGPPMNEVKQMASEAVHLPVEGEMPSLGSPTAWLNSKPLTSASLHGKVVLIEFWTYTCINWRRQLPYVRVRLFVNFAVLELRESPAACRGLLF